MNAPRVMLSEVRGDFMVETKISATMDENDEGAGILVWGDASHCLRLDRMSRTIGNPVEQQILFAVDGGAWTYVTLPTSLEPTYLRLVRDGDQFSAYYTANGATWVHVEDLMLSVPEPIAVGLDIINVYHEGTFFADFDYFKLLPNQ